MVYGLSQKETENELEQYGVVPSFTFEEIYHDVMVDYNNFEGQISSPLLPAAKTDAAQVSAA